MNDTMLLGPTSVGEFVSVTIRGIQRKRLPVEQVRGGQTASFALKKVISFNLFCNLFMHMFIHSVIFVCLYSLNFPLILSPAWHP